MGHVVRAVFFSFVVVWSAQAFSPLGHQVVGMRVLQEVRRTPTRYPAFLTTIARTPRLEEFFLGGIIGPDLGALAGQEPAIQYNTHYERPGLWIKTLFSLAATDEERAYAWGWVTHLASDLHVHPWMDTQGLNYCDVGWRHAAFEATMDAVIAHTYASIGEQPRQGRHPAGLVYRALTTIENAPPPDAAYEQYLRTLHERCPKTAAPRQQPRDSITDQFTQRVRVLVANAEFDVAGYVQLLAADGATESKSIRDTLSTNALTRTITNAIATALERQEKVSLPSLRLATNADMVNLYGLVGAGIEDAYRKVSATDWQALDRNADTGVAVGDPALKAEGLVAWYAFDDPNNSGRESISGLHGTGQNIRLVPGLKGMTASFSQGWLMMPTSPLLNLKDRDFTLSILVKGTAPTPPNRNWFTKASVRDHRYGIGGDGIVGLNFYGGAGGTTRSTTNVFDGTWHHVAAIKRGGTAELWIDGRKEGSAPITTDFPDDGAFAIGRDGQCCEFFTGQLDEARIWHRALSPSDLTAELNRIGLRR
jgi:hypothetical protein